MGDHLNANKVGLVNNTDGGASVPQTLCEIQSDLNDSRQDHWAADDIQLEVMSEILDWWRLPMEIDSGVHV